MSEQLIGWVLRQSARGHKIVALIPPQDAHDRPRYAGYYCEDAPDDAPIAQPESPRAYVSLSQAPGVYQLAISTPGVHTVLSGSLDEFAALGARIVQQVCEQHARDAEACS